MMYLQVLLVGCIVLLLLLQDLLLSLVLQLLLLLKTPARNTSSNPYSCRGGVGRQICSSRAVHLTGSGVPMNERPTQRLAAEVRNAWRLTSCCAVGPWS